MKVTTAVSDLESAWAFTVTIPGTVELSVAVAWPEASVLAAVGVTIPDPETMVKVTSVPLISFSSCFTVAVNTEQSSTVGVIGIAFKVTEVGSWLTCRR